MNRDRGSATVWVVIACLLTWSVTTLALSIGAAAVARHRADSAADLAALAGARALADGAGDPCAAAVQVATASRATVVGCEQLADGSVQVVVEAPLPQLLDRWPNLPPAKADARAGGTLRTTPMPSGDLASPIGKFDMPKSPLRRGAEVRATTPPP